ncbi:Flp family type IVb pilin [Hydrogenophaga sp.]|uniref:Flp family type IVb pilin n=1 Tax=Hydrogenophaga sp. TaxID=1904254 RepID=UPI0027176805|nr:Flp family type IVb pilin [Hydrogenophaga sp.]MDO8905331.1 Flp family type IVb pilin [Hydrogenophaga sp.]
MPTHRKAKSTQQGVTSIEYALLAALIALVIIGSVSVAGTGNGGLWGTWTSTVLQAIGGG